MKFECWLRQFFFYMWCSGGGRGGGIKGPGNFLCSREGLSLTLINFCVGVGTSEEILVPLPLLATRRGNLKSLSSTTAVHSRYIRARALSQQRNP